MPRILNGNPINKMNAGTIHGRFGPVKAQIKKIRKSPAPITPAMNGANSISGDPWKRKIIPRQILAYYRQSFLKNFVMPFWQSSVMRAWACKKITGNIGKCLCG